MMNKLRLSLLSTLLVSISAMTFAARVDETKALEKAKQFYQQKKTTLLRSAPDFRLILACRDTIPLLRSSETPAYFYIYNIGLEEGFVIVSGDDATKSILGYSDKGSFSAENMPENLKSWLDLYKAEIKYAMEQNLNTTLPDSTSQVSLRSTATVEPLLGNIKWDQGNPFNLLCPVDQTVKETTVTGCVATAMAQIMKYYQWPVTGTGSNTYTTTSYGALTVDFSKTNYDWTNMLDSYGGSSTPRQDSAVAKLMYHCGVAANMDYALARNGGSGASENLAAIALCDYFGYDPDIQRYLREYYTDSNWKSMLKNELNAGRPVLYSGQSQNGGHAFVCDGYDSNNLFHINWGWGGLSNGYFELSALTPGSYGTGATADGFNQSQGFVGGIRKPDGKNNRTYQIGLITNGLTSSKTTMTKAQATDLSFGFINAGIRSFSGKVGIGLFKNGTFQNVLQSVSFSNFPSNNYYPNYPFNNISLSGFTAGTYQIYGIYQPTDSTTWHTVMGTNVLNNYLNVTISGSTPNSTVTIQKPVSKPSLSLTQPIQQIENVYNNKNAYFSVTIQNTGTEFYSNLGIRLDSVSNSSISQYINYGVVCIPAGETKTFTFSGTVTCKPGSYYAVAAYDSTNAFSTNHFKLIGPNNYEYLPVTVLKQPAAPVPSLTQKISLENANIYKDEEFTLNASVTNTGGFFDSQINAYVFNSDGSGYSLGSLNPQTVTLETNETQNVSLKGTLSLDPGNYHLVLYYKLSSWTQFSPGSSAVLDFALQEKSTGMKNAESGNYVIYPNPASDQIQVGTSEPIRQLQVTDLSGRILLSSPNCSSLSVSSLNPGIYLLRMETKNGISTEKFVKE